MHCRPTTALSEVVFFFFHERVLFKSAAVTGLKKTLQVAARGAVGVVVPATRAVGHAAVVAAGATVATAAGVATMVRRRARGARRPVTDTN